MDQSLSDAYQQNLGEFGSFQRLYAGTTLFTGGVLFLVAGLVLATMNIEFFGMNNWQQWEAAGVLAGLGLPASFIGVFTVMPSGRRTRLIAASGALICFAGVGLFFIVFPHQWHGDPTDLTFPTVSVYFLGAVTTFWSMFSAIVDFKTRNNPGGTVELKVTQKGETRYVEVDKSEIRENNLGGLGFFGEQPDGEVETQTNTTGSESSAASSTTTQSDAEVLQPSRTTSWPEYDDT